ncbi:MAG: twin-arginine translocase subunit TatC, partial [Pseudomonas sp.]|nr:twin-arginine translocase subunit TatC [Pseudomonas sp.]
IGQYLDFVLTLFFAFGVAFEIPVATFLLIWIGIVDVATLRKSRPYVIVGCFVVGMVLTPPDVFSQTLLAVPMWMLFEVGLLFGAMARRRDEAEAEADAAASASTAVASRDDDQPPAPQA